MSSGEPISSEPFEKRPHELLERSVGFGRASADGNCFPVIATFDPVYAREAPIDLILFEGVGSQRVMKVPSVGGQLKRRGWSWN